MSRAERITLALALAAVFVASVLYPRRGLPNRYSYHQDAVAPLRALGFFERYANPKANVGDKYPTFAYLYFGAAARVALALRDDPQAAALLEIARERGPDGWALQIDPTLWVDMAPYEDALSDMIAAGRIASALANVLLALATGLLAARLFGGRRDQQGDLSVPANAASRPRPPPHVRTIAAALVGFNPYVIYYGHTMNVDAPCLAFALFAMYFVARGTTSGGYQSAVLAGVAAALAVATKDQIAAWLAFVPLALIGLELRWRRAGRPSPRAVRRAIVAASAFFVVYAFAANLVFDADGWIRHARFGLSSDVRHQYDMVSEFRQEDPLRAIGYLIIYVATYLYRSAGPAGAVLALVGLGYGLARLRAATLLLLLPSAGYLVVFVLRMGLAYPRHLLPVYLPLWILGAAAIAALLYARRPTLRAGGWVGCALVLMVVWRGATVNRLWAHDPRARAAAWIAESLPAGWSVVALTNHATPPPKIPADSPQRWTSGRDFVEAVEALDPPMRIFVRSTVLRTVVRPQHPEEERMRTEIPAVIEVFGREVWHPILDDIDAAPIVVIAAKP